MDPYRAVGCRRSTVFWHGGFPGLTVGDEIRSDRDLVRLGINHGSRADDRDRAVVYFTTNLAVARAYAALFPTAAGTVYRLAPSPASSLRIDPDLPDSYCARSATVSEVVETDVTMARDEVVQALAAGQVWIDGRRVYTEDGYLTPSPSATVTAEALRRVGTWMPASVVDFGTARIVEPELRRYERTIAGHPPH